MAIVKTDSVHYSNIAAKIREKTGEATTYKPSQMTDGIEAVYEAGKGARVAVVEKDVNFYDYDGTLLYSYTLDEVQTLTELPPLPTQDGLICQEWNWTLDELKALGRPMTVGATYITDDGATRLHLDIPKDARKTVPLYFSQSVANGVTINWGDGSATETVSGTGYVSTSHTYATGGEYTISLMPLDNCNIVLGNNTDTSVIGAMNTDADRYKGALLASANIGKNVTLGKLAFCRSVALTRISMPSTTVMGTAKNAASCFDSCPSLRFVVISRANTFLGLGMFADTKALFLVSIPPTVLGIANENFLAYSSALMRVDFPNSIEVIGWNALRACLSLVQINKASSTRIDESAFKDSFSLKRAVIGEGQKSIFQTFNGCHSLSEVDIPSTITSIGSNAFYNCYGMTKYDFTKLKAVPTLSNTNAFNGIQADCIIVVPDNLLTAWKAATNWSTYASYIKGASEV